MTTEGLVVLLFTDLVSCLTAWITNAGEERRRTHFSLLERAVTASGGAKVKNQGDGLVVVFPSAIQAAAYAVAMQRTVAEHSRSRAGPAIRMRIRLHSGEPCKKEADFFGTAVAAVKGSATTLRAQVPASELTAALGGSGGGFRFRLKGDQA